jgi:hypothetical protein
LEYSKGNLISRHIDPDSLIDRSTNSLIYPSVSWSTQPLQPNQTMELETPLSREQLHDESHIENLLSEKLMEGFVLLEKSCPVCATPLVRSEEEVNDDDGDGSGSFDIRPTMVPSLSFDQPFQPVGGVPFCVACQSHVITQECEISILEHCDSLKNKGSILVALQDGSTMYEDTVGSQSKKEEEQPSMVPTILEENNSEEEKVIDVTHIEDTQQLELVAISSTTSESNPAKNELSDENEHADEKKEEEPFENQNNDEIMAEYSVR